MRYIFKNLMSVIKSPGGPQRAFLDFTIHELRYQSNWAVGPSYGRLVVVLGSTWVRNLQRPLVRIDANQVVLVSLTLTLQKKTTGNFWGVR